MPFAFCIDAPSPAWYRLLVATRAIVEEGRVSRPVSY